MKHIREFMHLDRLFPANRPGTPSFCARIQTLTLTFAVAFLIPFLTRGTLKMLFARLQDFPERIGHLSLALFVIGAAMVIAGLLDTVRCRGVGKMLGGLVLMGNIALPGVGEQFFGYLAWLKILSGYAVLMLIYTKMAQDEAAGA